MSIDNEIAMFLMEELQSIGEHILDENERAMAAVATIAACGQSIPEGLLRMYLAKVPNTEQSLYNAVSWCDSWGLISVECGCSMDDDPLCYVNYVRQGDIWKRAKHPSYGADRDRWVLWVAELQDTLYN